MRRFAWEKGTFAQAVMRRKDIAQCNRYATHLKAWIEAFGAERVLVCFYEDLQVSRQAYVDRVCDFMGIARFPVGDIPVAEERTFGVPRAPRSRLLASNARKLRIWLGDNNWLRLYYFLERRGVWDFCSGGGEEFAPVDPALEARLRDRYRPEIEELEKIVARDLSAWKNPS